MLKIFSILTIFFCGLQPIPKPKNQLERGKLVYNTYCLSCHMENGAGVPRMTSSLVKSPFVLGSKKKLVEIVLLGSDAFVDEPNRNYKNLMAPLDNLTDQEIADVLTFIRKNFGNNAIGISAVEVKQVRVKL